MAIFHVTIATYQVEVYGGLPACKEYLATSSTPQAIAFTALATDEEKARRLVDATRFLDAQDWQGAPTTPAVDATTLAWPRTGVTLADGTAVDANTVPTDLVRAAFELAALIAADPSIVGKADQGSNVATLQAGSASISYFQRTDVKDGTATVLPPTLDRLIAKYLNGGTGASARGGAWLTSDDDSATSSYFSDCAQYKRAQEF
jgi:hypothetical protein